MRGRRSRTRAGRDVGAASPHGDRRRHRHHAGRARSGAGPTGLNVGRPAAPQERFGERGGGGDRQREGARGEGERPPPGGHRRPAGILPSNRVVEVGAGRQGSRRSRAASRTPPAPAQVTDPLGLHPRARSRASSARAGTWTRWRGRSSASQRSPNSRAWTLAGFGIATTITPPGHQQRAARSSAAPGSGRCSSECQKTIAAQRPLTRQLGGPRRRGESSGAPARPPRGRGRRGVEQRPVTGPHVEDRPGGAIWSRRTASRPRRRRSTRSPSPQNARRSAGTSPRTRSELGVARDRPGRSRPRSDHSASGSTRDRQRARSAAPHHPQTAA